MAASQEALVAVLGGLEVRMDQLGAEGATSVELEAMEGGLVATAEAVEVQEVGGVLPEAPGVREGGSEEAW